jgi:hypothetical protein
MQLVYDHSKRRLDQAHKAIAQLESEVQAWRDGDPFEITTTIATDHLSWKMQARVRTPIDSDGWGGLFGTAIHQLRADLDNIVWDLVRIFEAEPTKTSRVHFPVCYTESAWNADLRDSVGKLPNEVLHALRFFQPFTGRDLDVSLSPEHTPLAQLHSYDIMDKHRVAPLAGNLTDWVSSAVVVTFEGHKGAQRNREKPYLITDRLDTDGTLEISQSVDDPIRSVGGTLHVPYRLVVLHDQGGVAPLVTGPQAMFRFTTEIVASLLSAGDAALAERGA